MGPQGNGGWELVRDWRRIALVICLAFLLGMVAVLLGGCGGYSAYPTETSPDMTISKEPVEPPAGWKVWQELGGDPEVDNIEGEI